MKAIIESDIVLFPHPVKLLDVTPRYNYAI